MSAPALGVETIGVDDWRTWQVAHRLSRRTIDERVRVIRLLHNEIGVQPTNVTALHLVDWMANHDRDWSDSTACTYTSYLAAWFKWLQITDRRPDNPLLKVGRPRMPEREPRPIADADVVKLLTLRGMWGSTRRMILLALLAGLRVHEIAKVRGEDFDFSSRMLWVRGKGRKLKSIPLHPILVEVASEMPPTGWWFPQRSNPGAHVLDKSVSDIIGRAMRRAGVYGTPHALRHWYATKLLEGGADLLVVKELLRHKSVASTQIYARVPESARRDAINTLDPYSPSSPAVR